MEDVRYKAIHLSRLLDKSVVSNSYISRSHKSVIVLEKKIEIAFMSFQLNYIW